MNLHNITPKLYRMLLVAAVMAGVGYLASSGQPPLDANGNKVLVQIWSR